MAKTRERMAGPFTDKWLVTVYRKEPSGESMRVERTPEFILRGGNWTPYIKHGGWYYPVQVRNTERYILIEGEDKIQA